jgi:hypothetical protein
MAPTPAHSGLKAVKEFFGMDLPEMKAEWAKGGLSARDREEIAGGISDGSLTYPDLLLGPEPEAA